MSEQEPLPEFLTTKEVAELLRIKERKLYDLVSAQEIPCVKATGKLLFPRRLIDAWLEAQTELPSAGIAPALANGLDLS